MALADSRIAETSTAVQTMIFLVLGIVWILPLLPLIRWMQKPDGAGLQRRRTCSAAADLLRLTQPSDDRKTGPPGWNVSTSADPSITLPVPPQVRHGCAPILPEPPQSGQMFSPVPGCLGRRG